MTLDKTLSLGLLETTGYTPSMVAMDVMTKAADVRVVQTEINDFLGIIIKIVGQTASVHTAIEAGREIADRMRGKPIANVINSVDDEAWKAIESPAENNPLIQQDVVHFPNTPNTTEFDQQEEPNVASESYALGFIETQGFTAVFEAIDTACKAANVEVIGKEKLGGGYVTVVIKGDVAAVNAAIDAGRPKVEALGTLIAAHVIPRPTSSVLGLLPKI